MSPIRLVIVYMHVKPAAIKHQHHHYHQQTVNV